MSQLSLLLAFGLCVALTIILIAKFQFNSFVVLYLMAIVLAFVLGLPPQRVVKALEEGLGGVVGYVGVLVLAGYVIAEFIERSGGVVPVGELALKFKGQEAANHAVGAAGFILAPPLMCGLTSFITLAPVARAVAAATGVPLARIALTLMVATSASFLFVLPSPGILAAASLMGADFTTTFVLGLAVAVLVYLTGYGITRAYSRRRPELSAPGESGGGFAELKARFERVPTLLGTLSPVLITVALILAGACAGRLGSGSVAAVLAALGTPLFALVAGVVTAMLVNWRVPPKEQSAWVGKAMAKAAPVILLVGAGGALGAVLREAGVGQVLGDLMVRVGIPGVLLPFALSAVIKAVQGSSIVSVSTAAALVAPIATTLGLRPEIAALSCAAGALVPLVQVNDSGFWVFTGFSELGPALGYKVLTLTYLALSGVALGAVWFLSLVL